MHLLIVFLVIVHFGASLELVEDVQHYTGLFTRLNENNQQSNIEQLITDILYDSVRSIKCFALICDPMYCNMFTSKMFRKFKMHATYFMIQVDESEDLLKPYAETQATLNQVKVEECKFYIILIANAIQVSRFLRFGDRYRLLNTRSNFILFYDIRLFQTQLHYIWSRIVNVIFIREYGGNSGTKRGVAVPWFELSTVPFPTPIRGVFIPRRLDTWRRGHFRLGINLFRDKTSDLQNQTLKVVTFQHIPATVKTVKPLASNVTVMDTRSFTYSGLEVQILKTLAEQMNFESYIYEPENADMEKWGQKQDGKFSGVLGEMVRFQAEIALADLYYAPYHLDLMDLSIPYNTECLTFLTPESTTDNSWQTLVLPFKLYMWLTVILVVFVLGFILYSLAKFERHLYERSSRSKTCVIIEEKTKPADQIDALLNSPFKYLKFREQKIDIDDERSPTGLYLFEEPFNSFLYTYSMLLLVSLPKVPDGWSLRMIVGWYFLYCTLVVVSYKASMTAILTNPAPKITIDSLQELQRSELACGGWGENIRDFFLTSLDTAGQKIGARFEHINDSDAAMERVANGQFAYYENIYYLKAASVDRQMRIQNVETGNDSVPRDNKNLHIMSQCVINMPISLGLQKNSPIKPKVDVFIRRVIEGGFVTKWLDDTMQPTLNSEIYSGPKQSIALMNLGKLYCGFVALLIGYAISFLALAVELAYWHLIFVKHPHFDKYSKQIYIPVTKNK